MAAKTQGPPTWACIKGGKTGAGGRVGGPTTYRLKVGVHGRTPEQMAEHSRMAGLKAAETNKKNGTGIYGISKEENSLGGQIGGAISGAYICHNRWHADRNKVNLDCFLCQLHGTSHVLPKAQRDGFITNS